MQPVWHDCVLIHQVSYAFQHSLEVVLLQYKMPPLVSELKTMHVSTCIFVGSLCVEVECTKAAPERSLAAYEMPFVVSQLKMYALKNTA